MREGPEVSHSQGNVYDVVLWLQERNPVQTPYQTLSSPPSLSALLFNLSCVCVCMCVHVCVPVCVLLYQLIGTRDSVSPILNLSFSFNPYSVAVYWTGAALETSLLGQAPFLLPLELACVNGRAP